MNFVETPCEMCGNTLCILWKHLWIVWERLINSVKHRWNIFGLYRKSYEITWTFYILCGKPYESCGNPCKTSDRLMNCVEKPMILVEHVYENRMKCMWDSYELCGETFEFCENPMIFCRRSMKFIFISWISATCSQKIETWQLMAFFRTSNCCCGFHLSK